MPTPKKPYRRRRGLAVKKAPKLKAPTIPAKLKISILKIPTTKLKIVLILSIFSFI